MPGGRPTDYSGEILIKTQDYIENHEAKGDLVPSVAGLAVELGIARSTIYDWASQEDKPEFSDMLDTILSTQERKLINGGMGGKYNSTITKLMMTKHGYSDRQEVDQTVTGEVQFTNGVPRPKE